MCSIEELSQEFSQQSLTEPLEPLEAEEYMEVDENFIGPKKESTIILDATPPPVAIPFPRIPVNLVLESCIQNPPALPCHNPYVCSNNSKAEKLKRANCQLQLPISDVTTEWLLAEWENTKYGGVFNDYRPKIVPWKKEEIISEQRIQEKEMLVQVKQDHYDGIKRLVRNLISTSEFHRSAIDDVQSRGVDINGTLTYLLHTVEEIKDAYKQELKRDKKEIDRLKQNMVKPHEIKHEKENSLKERGKQQVQQLTLMMKQIEDSEKNKNGCYVDSNVFRKVRQDWCGVLNEMKKLELSIGQESYILLDQTKRALITLEKLEEIQKRNAMEAEERPRKRRKLNSEAQKKSTSKP